MRVVRGKVSQQLRRNIECHASFVSINPCHASSSSSSSSSCYASIIRITPCHVRPLRCLRAVPVGKGIRPAPAGQINATRPPACLVSFYTPSGASDWARVWNRRKRELGL